MKRILLAATGLLAIIAFSSPQVSAQTYDENGSGKVKTEKKAKSSGRASGGQDRPATPSAKKSSQGPVAEPKTAPQAFQPRGRPVAERKQAREKPRKAVERADDTTEKKSGTAGRGGGSGEQTERNDQAERRDQVNRAERREKRKADEPASQAQEGSPKREAQQPEKTPEPEKTGEASKRERPATQAESAKDRERKDEVRDPEAAQQEPEKSSPKAAQQEPEKSGPKAAEYRQRVSEVERSKVVEAMGRVNLRRHDRGDINIRISVGVILPRTVEFYEWPEDIVVLVPTYRYYRYIVIGDEICVVDPDTRVIVDVIDRSRFRNTVASGGAILELSREEELIILARIDRRREQSGTGINLQIGRPLPGAVEFREFPDDIVRDVPKVRPYRYAVVDDEIAIIAPRSADVVRIITD